MAPVDDDAGDALPPVAHPLREVLVVTGLALLGVLACVLLGRFVPAFAPWVSLGVALLFLGLPAWLARRAGRDLAACGFVWQPLGKHLAWALGAAVLVLVPFALGFVWFFEAVCTHGWRSLEAIRCAYFRGMGGLLSPLLPSGFGELVLAQLVLVAFPEELFFRGYVQGRLEQAWPARFRFLGGGVGAAVVVSSALFAVAHVVTDHSVTRLAVFFPGLLFGWLRARTGSIVAPALLHAASNLWLAVLFRSTFR